MTTTSVQAIASGSWNEDVRWEFYLTDQLPPRELCTAVFCLAIQGDNGVVLTRTKRGWEMLGGHAESGESIEDALFREAHEEGGFTPERYDLFGYRKIISTKPIISRDGATYPHPVSYIPHYIARSNLPLEEVHGDPDEVLDRDIFSLSELNDLAIRDIKILEAGLRFL
jgi:8-oxo-dGTP pyrophosphatase MutT (NUDIX family)